VLERVGLARARVVLFVISSPVDERRGVAVAHEANPSVRIVVRTRYIRAIEDLRKHGASEVVVEEFESSLELFASVLECYEIPSNRIWQEVNAVRDQHYAMLRGRARPDLKLDALKHLGIHSALELVEVEDLSPAAGESATTLNLRTRTGAIQIAVVRDGRAIYQRDPSFRFRSGDTVVLVGEQDALARATTLFRRPAPEPACGSDGPETRYPGS
jgi:CPA2 family monovalent cation:H+ antiporter-2